MGRDGNVVTPEKMHVVSITMLGKYRVEATINPRNQIQRIKATVTEPALGDFNIEQESTEQLVCSRTSATIPRIAFQADLFDTHEPHTGAPTPAMRSLFTEGPAHEVGGDHAGARARPTGAVDQLRERHGRGRALRRDKPEPEPLVPP